MMIKKYVFGNPYETGATVLPVEPAGGIPERFRFAAETGTFSYTLKEKDLVFGLGEMVRGINKRGWIYVSNNADDPEVLPEGDRYVKAALNEVLVFLRPGCELPLATPARHVEQIDEKQLTRIIFAKS